jgi:hypothetical protein
MPDAGVVPFQPIPQDGYASVTPLPPETTFPCVVPLENQATGNITVEQKDYPAGLVIIPQGIPNQGSAPVTLPLESTSNKQATINLGGPQTPNGVVILFTSKK